MAQAKLVLYSGGQCKENHYLHSELSGLVGRRKRKTFTYIPYCSEDADLFYGKAIARYQAHGFTDFICLPLDQRLDREALSRALRGDVIYLAGGNTFYILKHLQRQGLISKLRKFAEDGGILAGLSAGAHVLTPNVRLAGYPNFDRDTNDVKLRDLAALDMVGFEFFPHYIEAKRYTQALTQYSRKSGRPVFACKDGSGIVVDGHITKFFGKVFLFNQGRKVRVH